MLEKFFGLLFLFGFLTLLDQVILTSQVPGTNLRYSWLTTQRQSAAGFIEPSCSAAAYRLTLISGIRLSNSLERSGNFNGWKQGHGFLKLPTWGCGLAFYDHGGGTGRAGRMYRWGEGRNGDTWFGRHSTHCGEMVFILVEESRLLCVSGADVEYLS